MTTKNETTTSDQGKELGSQSLLNGELVTNADSHQMVEDIILGRTTTLDGVEDPANAQEQIVRRILTAPDEDAVLAEDSTVATKEMIGVALEVNAFRLLKSQLIDKDTGEMKEGAFMIINARQLKDEKPITLNTGAPKIMAQLIRLKQLDRLPAKVRVTEVGKAQPGQNRALQLIAA